MSIPVITVTSSPEHTQRLIKTLDKFGWSRYIVETEWKGFGTKIIETYNLLKKYPEIERFVFVDAFDTLFWGNQEELYMKLAVIGSPEFVLSAERGLWPPILHPFRSEYAKTELGFDYINSGCYFATSEAFCHLVETYSIDYIHDDQLWLNMCYLLNKNGFYVDHAQSIFNSHSFIEDGEYSYSNRPGIGGVFPLVTHQNGRSLDDNLDMLI